MCGDSSVHKLLTMRIWNWSPVTMWTPPRLCEVSTWEDISPPQKCKEQSKIEASGVTYSFLPRSVGHQDQPQSSEEVNRGVKKERGPHGEWNCLESCLWQSAFKNNKPCVQLNDLPMLLFKEEFVYNYMNKRLQGSQPWAVVGWRMVDAEDSILLLFIACFLYMDYNERACATFTIKNDKVNLFRTILISPENHLRSLSSWCNCLPGSLSLAEARLPCCIIFLVVLLPHLRLPKDQLSAHPWILRLTDYPA